jgi:hypothetical protein
VSPVKYELGFYIPDDAILHSHCCENLKSYIHCVSSFDLNTSQQWRTVNLIMHKTIILLFIYLQCKGILSNYMMSNNLVVTNSELERIS